MIDGLPISKKMICNARGFLYHMNINKNTVSLVSVEISVKTCGMLWETVSSIVQYRQVAFNGLKHANHCSLVKAKI